MIPDETDDEKKARLDAANRFHSYRKGWRTGARSGIKEEVFMTHPDVGIRDAYERGFADGYDALGTAMVAACKHYGHVPNILRTQESST